MSNEAGQLILIVEDEAELADIFRGFLERDGFRVAIATCGVTAVDLHRRLAPALVVLDIGLPKLDGFEVLGRIRASASTPVIMSTALGEDVEKLAALRTGADDYIVKPFNPLELVARAKAVLRRSYAIPDPGVGVRLGELEIDTIAHEARRHLADGTVIPVRVTATEFRILRHLTRQPRRVFARSEIVSACLAENSEALERTVDSHVRNLRAKLDDAGFPPLIYGVHGVGYRFEPA